ncbi:Transmembrane protein [Parasponia andersonii]|uniref:Transmembrane protein n=1 Tax=Parasponia andersonii TaxID=3476 RepID=A0A2P5AKD2_PARAD|nr:Transmembrane protein [Parasponia andersonii]
MALGFIWNLHNLWPFSVLKHDDLRVSHELVRKLPIPERTKQFVYAIRDQETRSVIYVLSSQSLSERSVSDVKCLIREIKPDAVVAQVGLSHGAEILAEECELDDVIEHPLPTSSFEVLRRCFLDKVGKEKYEDVAGNLVLREVFGVSFYGHLLAAKKAAQEVGSSFLVIESPCLSLRGDDTASESDVVNKFQGLVSSLAPQKFFGPVATLGSRRFLLTNDIQSQMVKVLSPYLEMSVSRLSPSSSVAKMGSEETQLQDSYEAPPFAQSIYPLLVDLHNIFVDLPSIGRALAHAQKMLYDVNKGEAVDNKIMSEVYTFRIAIEGLRIALNNAARLPLNKIGDSNSGNAEFSELSVHDKSQVLLAHALRSQTKKFKTIVAVVDASSLAGLRKHWNHPVPSEVEDLIGQLCAADEGDEEMPNQVDRKRLLTSKPVVAVGAGASAVLGVSSLSKVVPASTFMKVITFNVPASLKIILTQTQKALALVLGKTLGPSKIVAPSFTGSGFKMTSVLKATASAEKIRAVAHGVIASAEKTSLSAMRTAFYEIMRKRQVRPIGFLPWATFGCSVATCTGLLAYGDGFECAAESLPAAPSIASLGRGVERLQEVSQEVRQTNSTRIQKSIESLMHRLKKAKIQ